jgi:hypothetical protein
MGVTIVERDEAGHLRRTFLGENNIRSVREDNSDGRKQRDLHILSTLSHVFLPSGYPASVSPDYLHYQIYNSLQAFCSSLAGLIATRATLEGFGVGNAAASATHALLLTVLQEVFSRVTTIVAAYYVGTCLFPEAKTYRFLADILFDAAIVLDVLSPLLNSVYVPFYVPLLFPGSASGLRIVALCLSASLRALCAIAAGGSKSALSLHFATPVSGKGDLGELNAKDGSKETVLSLLVMLLGSFLVPRLTTRWSTYIALFLLLGGHLVANFIAVRGVVLRSLNRQRAGIAWTVYREKDFARHDHRHQSPEGVLTPNEIASRERIFDYSGILRNECTGKTMGHCYIGSSFSSVLHDPAAHNRLLRVFQKERYILCFDAHCVIGGRVRRSTPLRMHICLKEGYTPLDQLKAWVHAEELGRVWTDGSSEDDPTMMIESTYRFMNPHFTRFIEHMRQAGWNLDEGALLTRSPKAILVSADEELSDSSTDLELEKKKNI